MKKENQKYLRQIFEVITPLEGVIDEESLRKEYKGDIEKVARFLYEQEGFWWNEKLKLIKVEIIKKPKRSAKNKKIKFIIKRTSQGWYRKEKMQPCKEAKLEEITILNCETKKPLEQRKEWIIEFKDLEDLLKFCDKYREIIISPLAKYYEQNIKYEIEIYDTYRE